MEQGIAQAQNVGNAAGMEQGIAQPAPAQNVGQNVGMQPAPAQNVLPDAIQNIIAPVPHIDALSWAVRNDWMPFGDTFDFISPNATFWFSKTLKNYMITSCRIQILEKDTTSFVQESPPYSFVHSGHWRDRSIPIVLICPGQVLPTTPGLLFAQADRKELFLYWPGISKYFKEYCGSIISVSYRWKRSRTDGRFLLVVRVAQDSQLLQSSGGGGQQTGDMTAGHSNAIGGASGSAEPQDRGETSAAGASRARHGTSPHLTRGNQLSSSRVLRSMTRR